MSARNVGRPHPTRGRHAKETPVSREQAAALHEPLPDHLRESIDENTSEGTENTLFDTSQHSDAPGPFGTD